MNRRGQSQFLSIGVIFSIILIIAIIGISGYVIVKFVGIGNCADLGLFKKDFQDSVDRAWSSEITNTAFKGDLPRGVEVVCFGFDGQGKEWEALKLYQRYEANTFFYPPEQACDAPYTNIEHIKIDEWTCFSAVNREVEIGLVKGSFDDLVSIRGKHESGGI